MQVGQHQGTLKIWAGDERIAVHPRAQKSGQRYILPGQWRGLPQGDNRPRREAMAVQIPVGEVERRSSKQSLKKCEARIHNDCRSHGAGWIRQFSVQSSRGFNHLETKGWGIHSRWTHP